jgi:glycine cleavage system H protein
MSLIPEDVRYTKTHEWIRTDADAMVGTCGITDHAQEMLPTSCCRLPEKGAHVEKGAQIGVVESVKAVSDVYAPVSGVIADVNTRLEESPELLNSDPYGEGWIFTIEIREKSELDGLMDASAYEEHVASGE